MTTAKNAVFLLGYNFKIVIQCGGIDFGGDGGG